MRPGVFRALNFVISFLIAGASLQLFFLISTIFLILLFFILRTLFLEL